MQTTKILITRVGNANTTLFLTDTYAFAPEAIESMDRLTGIDINGTENSNPTCPIK